MLAFAEAARGCTEVQSVTAPASSEGLTAYALRNHRVRKAVLVNRGNRPLRVSVAELGLSSWTAMVLTAPALDSTSGITFDSAAVGADGSWRASTTAGIQTGAFWLPAATAVVLRSAPGR